jgi:class 3 adenylate cyclase
VRPVNLTLRGDPAMAEVYRTRFEGRPADVMEEGATVTVEYPRWRFFDRRRAASWITLNAAMPWRIEARGMSAVTADLGALDLRGLEVPRAAAQKTTLMLPRPAGVVPIRVAGGVAETTIHRPAGVAVSVDVQGGASGLVLDDQRFAAVGGGTSWRSHGFEDAAARYELVIEGGARNLAVGTLAAVAEPAGTTGRVLATVLFTDVVGSTERAAEMGDRRWRELLDRHDDTARTAVEAGEGRLVKTTGDGILAVFDAPGNAIESARALRDQLQEIGLPIRAGVHTGEVEFRGKDVGGIGVHLASRIMDAAVPGEILVSRTVRDLVAGSGVDLRGRGTHALKGVSEEWELYAVTES